MIVMIVYHISEKILAEENNPRKGVCLEARSADQSTVNIPLCHETVDVVWFHAAAIENTDGIGGLLIEDVNESYPDCTMYFLRLHWSRSSAGADCPDWFISND